jgi:hypothetical protein
VELVDAPVVDHRGRRGAEVEIDGLRRPALLPEQRPVARIAEQADVAAEGGVDPLAVGGGRLGRVGVLAMPSPDGLAAMGLALPHHLARPSVEARSW